MEATGGLLQGQNGSKGVPESNEEIGCTSWKLTQFYIYFNIAPFISILDSKHSLLLRESPTCEDNKKMWNNAGYEAKSSSKE